ncbi:hypothetical protein CIP107577_01964 [Corynebacterium diphtheriae]|nr:hypothetical protein CIP107577_01964 [Corynebacterium diphtheriae]
MEIFTTESGKQILTPALRDDVFVKPVQENSTAAQACTEVPITPGDKVRFPIIEKDAAANWVGEGEQITETAPTINEVVVTTNKVAALTVITNELKNDTKDASLKAMMAGLIRQIITQIDKAFFTTKPIPKAPKGVGLLEGVTNLTTNAKNLDVFIEANTVAVNHGGYGMQYFTNPTDLEKLLKVKEATSSNRPLLAVGSGQGAVVAPDGSPIITSPHVEAGTIWGIPKSTARMVYETSGTTLLGSGPEIVGDSSAYFAWDSIAYRATYRTGFGFLNPAAVVKIAINGG